MTQASYYLRNVMKTKKRIAAVLFIAWLLVLPSHAQQGVAEKDPFTESGGKDRSVRMNHCMLRDFCFRQFLLSDISIRLGKGIEPRMNEIKSGVVCGILITKFHNEVVIRRHIMRKAIRMSFQHYFNIAPPACLF